MAIQAGLQDDITSLPTRPLHGFCRRPSWFRTVAAKYFIIIKRRLLKGVITKQNF